MDELFKAGLKSAALLNRVYQPKAVSAGQLQIWLRAHPAVKIFDNYDNLLEEIWHVDHPGLIPGSPDYRTGLTDFKSSHYNQLPPSSVGQWFYYPWREALVHVLEPKLHYHLRTARNRNLISVDEQTMLSGSSVGIVGLSTGQHVLTALALVGNYNLLKIADPDTLDLTNLNRIRGSMADLGIPKTTIAARLVYDLDPYAKVEIFEAGLTVGNLDSFTANLDIVVDEMDDLLLKTRLRQACQFKNLPLVMATDLGDNTVMDVERYDVAADQALFNSQLSPADIDHILEGSLTKPEWLRLSAKIIGFDDLPLRVSGSVSEIGRTIAGVPQIGSSSMVAGALTSYVVRLILTNQEVKSGKHVINFEASLMADYGQPAAVALRLQALQKIKSALEL